MIAGMAFAIDIPNIGTVVGGVQVMGAGVSFTDRGDVLLALLYAVRNLINPDTPEGTTIPTTQQTLITIVNTDTTFGVIARLRFREWKRSREVLDIDIPLTTNDVWVGEVSRLAAGGGVLNSPDQWISALPAPDLVNSPFPASAFPAGGIAFRTFLIDEASEDAKLARTEYGYFEVIGEERVGAPSGGSFPRLTAVGADRDVKNVLMGNVYLIRPEAAQSHQYNMTAVSNFAIDPTGIWENPATVFPNLLADVQGEGTNPGLGGFNQLEFILSKRFVYFTYVDGIESVTNTPQSTSVVITFPTKHFHYNQTTHTILPATTNPFGTPFTGGVDTVGDGANFGEIFGFAIYDRSENTFTTPGQPPISPPPPVTPTVPRMPFEVNVIGLVATDPPTVGFRNNIAIATANTASNQVFTAGYGWIDLSPLLGQPPDETRTARQGETGVFNFFNNPFTQYFGLPALGIVMTEFFNDSVNGYYGNTVPWQYAVDWVQPLVIGVP